MLSAGRSASDIPSRANDGHSSLYVLVWSYAASALVSPHTYGLSRAVTSPQQRERAESV